MVDDSTFPAGPLINGRSAFWQINIGHIGVAACGLVSAGILWASTTARIGTLETARAEDKARLESVAAEAKLRAESVAAEAKTRAEAVAAEAKLRADTASGEYEKRMKELSDTVDRMNKEGTQASQKGIYQESDFSHATERRVQALEKTMADMNTQLGSINATVARCDERLQWLTRERTVTAPLHR